MSTIVKLARRPRADATATPEEERPRRAITDDMVEMVRCAQDHAGEWIELGRVFKTRANADSTASCLRRGFLRVRPQPGEPTYELGEYTYLALPVAPEVKVTHDGEVWRLSLRV